MQCPKCGNKIKSGAKFCVKCGAALNGGGYKQTNGSAEGPLAENTSWKGKKACCGVSVC